MRNQIVRLALVCPMVLSFAAQAFGARPNIVMIVGDDMGYADISLHGCEDIATPNIDAIAKEGVQCTNGYVSGPYCSPTRAGLLTGRYQTRFGHEFNPSAGPSSGLPLSETTIADRLKAAGYSTGLVGKWHLGSAPELHPQQRGFEDFYGFLAGAHGYFPGQGSPILRGTDPIEEKEYLTDAIGREAEAFIESHSSEPFFLYVAFNAVHTPMHADDARLKRFSTIKDEKRRKYAAMMTAMDDAIGGVTAKLSEEGLDRNTLVMFISDNGGPTMKTTAQNASNNAPLRGSKRTTLEGGVRVPFFVKWPGKLPPGSTYDKPVIQLDLTATALKAARVEAPAEAELDGVDLLPYLNGGDGRPHDRLYWRFGPQMAIREGDWKLVRYDPVVDGGRKGATDYKLYNLAEDIGEDRDLRRQHPDKFESLLAAWKDWDSKNVPPKWGEKRASRKQRRARVK